MSLPITEKPDMEKAIKQFSNIEFDTATLVSNIRAMRISHGISQAEMAEYLGYTRAAYNNNERGRLSTFELGRLLKIKKLFGITWSDLLGESAVDAHSVGLLAKIQALEKSISERDRVIKDLNDRLEDRQMIIDLLKKKGRD